jgi:sugar O-acyltransferase (sialic acid O-acetyltransferase NeuD family)
MMAQALDVVILGAGGHACVLIDALRASGEHLSLGAVDQNAALHGSLLLDVPVLGGDGLLPQLVADGCRRFVLGVAGARGNEARAAIFDRAIALGMHPVSVVHPAATVSNWAALGAGCQILAGAVVNARARLGNNVIVNTAAVVEHDCELEDHVHIATGARLAGGVRVAQLALVGAGATVRQSVSIGARAFVGAGAAVVKDVAHDSVVAGVPARELFQR